MTDCERANRWFFGCRWEHMYDTKGPSEELAEQIRSSWQLPHWLAKLGVYEQKYVGSICVRCGKTVDRKGLSMEDTADDT